MLDILTSYFRNAAKYHPEPEDSGKTTYLSKVGADFIFESAKALHKLQPTSPLFSQHKNLLQSIATSLQDLHGDLATSPPPDYLFFASLLYVLCLLRSGLDNQIIKTDIGQNLILAILQYHAHVTQLRKDIEEGFFNNFMFIFEQDWPEFVKLAEKFGIVLRPPVMRLPTDSLPHKGSAIQEEPRQPSGDTIVDVRVDPLGERSWQGNGSFHSALEMANDDRPNILDG